MENPQIVYGGFVPEHLDPTRLANAGIVASQNKVTGPLEGDEKLFVRFFEGAKFLGYESGQKGLPVFEPCDCVTIITEHGVSELFYELEFKDRGFGQKQPTQITAEIINRFGSQYDAYLREQGPGNRGTPFSVLPHSRIDVTATLVSLGIKSLEALITADNEVLSKIDGALIYKKQAEAYLDLSSDKLLQAKDLELDDLRKQLEILKSQANESKSINSRDSTRSSRKNKSKSTGDTD
jgi:hypothetical protein